MPESPGAHFQAMRDLASDRDEANKRVERDVVTRLHRVVAHINQLNLGLAKASLEELLEDLIHDHGAQDFRPLFDHHLSQLTQVREARCQR